VGIVIDPGFEGLCPRLSADEYTALEDSLRAEGCRDALVVWPRGDDSVLLDGHNRYAICTRLGLPYETKALAFETRDEAAAWVMANQMARRNLTDDQRAILGLRLQERLSAIAKRERAEAANDARWHGKASLEADVSSKENQATERARAAAAKRAHVSEWKVRTAKALAETAPALADSVLQGDISLAKAMQQARREQQEAMPTPPLPGGKYRVLYADPPWTYGNSGFDQSAAAHYPTLSVAQLCGQEPLPNGLNLQQIVSDACTAETVLFLWATSPLLPEALQVMSAWEFTYKANMVWDKERAPGIGWFLATQHEHLLIGVRSATPHPAWKPASVLRAAPGPHSKKPDEMYSVIERMYAGPYLELFARQERNGWEVWGNEVG
jgi:N6-adenosine-specific RNA methylase IME4